ncbi:Protein TPR3 [Camellia lanceoleosa]|uniref:Protein TPR3 n=1 Tax=Camellia lanceoleosa TaxID=1840588 RepID=A0ACC0FE20_9ERIC|nr:Protein TPR3 [Camellia lanceoleosa]
MLVTLAFGKLDLEKGVALSRTLFRYLLTIAGELRQHLEIDAHVGGVNDIAFAHPNKQLCIVRCGDDKTIKVDVVTTCSVADEQTTHWQFTANA